MYNGLSIILALFGSIKGMREAFMKRKGYGGF